MEEDRGPAVGGRLDPADRLDSYAPQPPEDELEGLVHLEGDVVEPRAAALEEARDRVARTGFGDQLELEPRAEAAHRHPAWHLSELGAGDTEEPRERVVGGDGGNADVIERDDRHQTTVEARW
jgi:hypothetical protein